MKYLEIIEEGYYNFDYDSYFNYIKKIKSKLSGDFFDAYIKNNFFHDYYVKNLEISSSENGKSNVLLTLSENYRDSSKRITVKYSNVSKIEYSNERGYQDDYLYGVISYNNKILEHEILLGDGKLVVLFDEISIIESTDNTNNTGSSSLC